MKKSITTFMTLGLLLLSGCATLAPSPTATPAPTETPMPVLGTSVDDIIGTWQLGKGDHAVFLLFDADGTFRTAQRDVTNLQDSPQQLGQFTLEGALLTIVTNEESPLCADQSGTYEVHLLEQGRISFYQLEEQCTLRGELNDLEPVSP